MTAHTTPVRKLLGVGLARFLEKRGRHITEAAGVLWYDAGARIYMSLPYQLALDPDPEEINKMLTAVRGLGVRYPSTARAGLPSCIYICRGSDYGFPRVQARLRTKVRRGLEQCQIRLVEPSELADQGLRLNLDTMQRQGRYDVEFADPVQWRRFVEALRESPAISAIGAFCDGQLASYIITYREDGWLHLLHQMSRLDYLERNPNPALTFSVMQQGLADPEIEAVSFGLMSLVEIGGLHESKLRLGFEAVSLNSVLQIHPAIAPILTSAPAVYAARAVCRLRPKDQRLERVATVLKGARLSLQGPVPAYADGQV